MSRPLVIGLAAAVVAGGITSGLVQLPAQAAAAGSITTVLNGGGPVVAPAPSSGSNVYAAAPGGATLELGLFIAASGHFQQATFPGLCNESDTLRARAGGQPPGFSGPSAIAGLVVDPGPGPTGGDAYLADSGTGTVFYEPAAALSSVLSAGGTATQCWGSSPANLQPLSGPGETGTGNDGHYQVPGVTYGNPSALALYNGDLYVADQAAGTVWRRSPAGPAGTLSLLVGPGPGPDGQVPATVATLAQVTGIALDASGNLYIAEGAGADVREVEAANHAIVTIAGTGVAAAPGTIVGRTPVPAGSAQFVSPSALAVDAGGGLLVADSGANAVDRIDLPSGLISTVVGTGSPGTGSRGDGGSAASAQLTAPTAVAIDAFGNILIGESGPSGHDVRRVAATSPVPPTGVTAAAGDASASVSWLGSSGGGIRSYTVTAAPGGQQVTTPDGSTTTAAVTGLINGTAYMFTVTATSAGGSSGSSQPSNVVTPQAGSPPPATAVGVLPPAGGTVATGSTPSPDQPLATAVTVGSGTTGSTVTVSQTASTESSPSGYSFGAFPEQVNISAPAASADNPLTLVFTVAASSLTVDPYSITMFRNGAPVSPCPGSAVASPDPCVSFQDFIDPTDFQFVVLTSEASAWNFGFKYQFNGFFAPVNNPYPLPAAVNTGKAGKSYPIKWRLRDVSNGYVSTLSAVTSITYKAESCTAFANDATATLETSSTGGTSLRFDSTASQYVYNWATPVAGCYTLFVKLADSTTHYAFFKLS